MPIKRSNLLDTYRGLAVLLMMIFHLCWDLRHFNFIAFSIYDPFWVYFRSLILLLFLSAVGWSSFLTTNSGNPKSFWKRDIKLFISACAISLTTYLAVPDQWVYFGILHFIFVVSLIARPLVKWPILSAYLGAGIICLFYSTEYLLFPNAFSTITQYLALPQKTLDIVFPFPWIGVILIGPIFGYFRIHKYKLPNSMIVSCLCFLGRHALVIYLIHQVILFALVAGLKMVLNFVF